MHQRRNAYLIGANGPEKQRAVIPLKYAEKDIGQLQKALSVYPCEFTSIESVVANTPFEVLPGLERLANRCERTDLLMVHFAGHAFPWGGHLYLICNQTDVDQKLFTSTAIGINAVKNILDQCRAKHKLLVLDCCHAGAAHKGGTWRGEQELEYALEDLKGSASIILSACASHKRTRELDKLELDNEYGAGFLSWALASAFTKEFASVVDDQALSFTDFWKWLPEVQRRVNKDLKNNEQIPTPLIFREEESGPDNEIWFTSHRRDNIRVNAHTEQKHREELAIFEREQFLQQCCPGANIEDFDKDKLIDYAQKQRDYNTLSIGNLKELCKQLDLTSSLGTPRRSAILLFHRIPNRYLHSALIRIDARAENNGTNVSDTPYIREEIVGPLNEQVEKALKWITDKLQTVSENIGAGKRTDRCEIPEKALREIVVNAIVHRDYEASASVRVRITPKQIIITNPGQLNSAIVNSNPPFAYGHSQARNPLLLDVFIKQGWAEGLSRGFEIVMEEFEKYGLPMPEIENLPSGLVQVTIQRPDLNTLLQSQTKLSETRQITGQSKSSLNTLPMPIEILCSYVHEDESLLQELHDHLSGLKRQGCISTWHDRQIIPGTDWGQVIDTHLETASLILLLVSAEFLTSAYCYEAEIQRAMQRHEANEALVLPIIVRPCDWNQPPFTQLQCLPRDGKPITSWRNVDEAFADVTAGIRQAIEDLPLLSASAPRAALPSVWNIPYPRNPFFTGRDDLLSRLHTQLQAGQVTALSQPQAICGLGGIGKTQIAMEYAYRYCQEYKVVLWVRADDQEALISSYNTIAALLKLPEREAPGQDITIQAVKTWLQTHREWLLILDNADDLHLLPVFLPPVAAGHILLTTRAWDMQRFAQRIEVEVLSPEQGAVFLLRRAALIAPDASLEQVSMEDHQLATQIAQEVGGLPLALDQAGAYLEATGMSLNEYQRVYQQYRHTLLRERRAWVLDHPEAVATTWSLSFERVEQQNAAAAELLRLCAYLAPDVIPENIITQGAPHLGPLLGPVAADPFLLSQAVEALRAYSLLQRYPRTQTLSVHRLVQVVLRDNMATEAEQQWKQRVVRAVNASCPNVQDVEQWDACELWLPHAQVCAIWIEQEDMTLPEAACLLNEAGHYLKQRARYAQAEPLYVRALSIREQQLGAEHLDTVSSLNNLASLYRSQGKYAEAEPLYVRALAIDKKAYGADHPKIATDLNNLAELYRSQGKYAEAEPLSIHALAIQEQQLGSQHPNTAQSLNNLAVLYQAQGKYEQSEPLLRRALEIVEQARGPEDSSRVSATLTNLAEAYKMGQKYELAEALLLRAQQIDMRRFGPKHPETAIDLNNLAELYRVQERYEQAEALCLSALAIREHVLGPKHPHTISSYNNLALIYHKQGKYQQAESLYQRILTLFEEVYRSGHPDLALSLSNLALLYEDLGKYEEAKLFYQRALAISEQMLSAEHPITSSIQGRYTALLRRGNAT